MKASKALFWVEFKLSLRDMNMPIFALGMPVVVMIIIGMLFGQSAFDGASYSFVAQSFGAVSAIAVCAAGAMGLPLVISNYRSRKILKRYFVTPIGPGTILGAQVAVYVAYSLASVVLVYGVAALLFRYSFTGSWPGFMGSYVLVMAAMFSVGVMVGGLAANERIASVLASVLYFPMLLFSGATLPYEVMPPVMQRIADVMPLTQGVKLLKASSLGTPLDEVLVPIAILLLWALVCSAVAIKFFKWE